MDNATGSAADETVEVDQTSDTDRRQLLGRVAGAAAAGLAIGIAGSGATARAADGQPVLAGNEVESTDSTMVRRTTAGAGNVFVATDSDTVLADGFLVTNPAAVGGYAFGANDVYNGVHGWSGASDGGDIEAGYGVIATARGDARAPLRLISVVGDPRRDGNDHAAGEITIDDAGTLWACVAGGVPGTWRKLQGPSTAGAYHPIEPVRCFDSRRPGYLNGGLIEPGDVRQIVCRDDHDEATGEVTSTDEIPAGATAITYNLTVTQTTGPNFLSVASGDGDEPAASSINFASAGVTVANGLTGKLNAAREIRIYCGNGPGSTQAIVDVNGYYL